MYREAITTQEEALSHLFLHCCFRDGEFNEAEIKSVADKLVAAGLHKELNFKEEVVQYKAYQAQLDNETAYLEYLLRMIMPTNELALYSYCMELCLSDGTLSANEEALLQKLATSLQIEDAEQSIIKRLMVQKKVVETQKLF